MQNALQFPDTQADISIWKNNISAFYTSVLATSYMAIFFCLDFQSTSSAEAGVHSKQECDILSEDKRKDNCKQHSFLLGQGRSSRAKRCLKPPGSSRGSWLCRGTAVIGQLFLKKYLISFFCFSCASFNFLSPFFTPVQINAAQYISYSSQRLVSVNNRPKPTFPWIIHLEGVDPLHVCPFCRFDLLFLIDSIFQYSAE